MKINELSRLTGVNAETIRVYRKKGYLKPQKQENGYYEYNMNDAAVLFELRKLRGMEMPMEKIEEYCTASRPEILRDLLDQREDDLTMQLEEIKRKIRYIKLEKRHMLECSERMDQRVKILQSIDEKIDLYDLKSNANVLAGLYEMTTPTLLIRKEILNGPLEDRKIPVKAGVGTYRYLYEANHIDPPKNAVIIPNGLCLTQMITLEDLNEMDLKQIHPLMSYAKEHNYQFLSDTTGYLACFEMHEGTPVFHYRIRACIKINDVIDPDTL